MNAQGSISGNVTAPVNMVKELPVTSHTIRLHRWSRNRLVEILRDMHGMSVPASRNGNAALDSAAHADLVQHIAMIDDNGQ